MTLTKHITVFLVIILPLAYLIIILQRLLIRMRILAQASNLLVRFFAIILHLLHVLFSCLLRRHIRVIVCISTLITKEGKVDCTT